ncbi:hypothetical protein OPV22_023260 [Ensete ventricosum]|uniref:non-specific serine/threonine protein kinase n=1 Tax=Ensete ventricosum TaxID=4639 RepID=A0AAV8QWI5_ENSVE|nr:hypothetical protein OPV22_023260 [Ensete ventricosum]
MSREVAILNDHFSHQRNICGAVRTFSGDYLPERWNLAKVKGRKELIVLVNMSSSPPPSVSATPPSSTVSPPPASLSPPSTPDSPPPSPPPDPGAPPPTPPPASPPEPPPPPAPAASFPPPATASPPPAASPPPPVASPPPATVSPPPPVTGSPPPSVGGSPPPPTAASPPPPTEVSPPPPIAASPPPPSSASSPPQTPNAPPPSSGSPPPPSPGPPTRTSPPPPSVEPPNAPPSPPLPPRFPSPPIPSAPAPKSPSTPARSPPAAPPSNSSAGAVPSPVQASPPLASPTIQSDNLTIPNSPTSNKSPPGPDVVSDNSPGGGGTKTGTAVAVGLVVVFVIFCFLGLVWYVKKRRKPVAGYVAGFVMPSPHSSSMISESPHPRSPSAPLVYRHKSGSVASDAGIVNAQSCFSYEELYEITNGFSPQNILGEGGFGCVYKGWFSDGREVAVKQLKVGSEQGEREFKAEVEIISRIHHRHLVSLVGYCISENQRLLVYDFVPNDTLHSHLHGTGKPVLDWPTRVKVAAGAARGIAYLHEDCHPRIIHRDIKSSNILLDNNFEAQVSDFGLARLAMDACTHVTTRVIGTFGYLAPEYASSGKLTERSDVYSFGVVLLELITGRKPVDDTQPMGDESLVEWARPRLSHALETRDFGELPDPRLEKNYNETEMFRMIEAAAACIRHSAAMRPQMGKVVRVLDILTDVDLNNGVKPGQSEIFNVAETAEIRLCLKRI